MASIPFVKVSERLIADDDDDDDDDDVDDGHGILDYVCGSDVFRIEITRRKASCTSPRFEAGRV